MPSWLDRILGRKVDHDARAEQAATVLRADAGLVAPAGPQGPLVGVVSSATRRYATSLARNEAIDATPASVTSIFNEAATGRTSRLIDLYKHSRLHDSRLDAVCATRVLAIQSRAWVMRPPPGYERDAEAIQVAANVTEIFNSIRGLQSIIGHLGHAALEHVAVAEHVWSMNSRGWWVSQPRWVHPNRAGWTIPGIEPCWSLYEAQEIAGQPFSRWPDKFIVHSPVAGRSDYPWMRGAMRSRAAASVVKRLGVRWWLKMLERWGQPQVVAYRADTATADDEGDEVIAALRAMGSDWRATLPEGWKLEAIPVQVQTDLHSRWVEWNALEDAIAILGQNLTTEIKEGSYAAAKAHQRVRLDILAADLWELAETITDQWIEPLVRYNWPGAPVPWMDFVLAPRSEITVEAYKAGLFTADEVRQSMGYDPELGARGGRRFDEQPATAQAPATVPAEASAMVGDPTMAAVAATGAAVSDTALNGAQVASLQGLLASVANGTLAADAAVIAISNAFPSISRDDAAAMVQAQASLVVSSPSP